MATSAVARAQQPTRPRSVAVIQNLRADDPEAMARSGAFLQGLQEMGWAVGRNLQLDFRWSEGDPDHLRRDVADLITRAPDVILAAGTIAATEFRRATRAIPVVFVQVTDPVGAGLVASLARPGGNMTGFTFFEYGLSTKWLELLRRIAPKVTRTVVFRDPTTSSAIGTFGAIQGAATAAGIEVFPIDMRDATEIDSAFSAFARQPSGGAIVTPGPIPNVILAQIVSLAARHRVSTVYPYGYMVRSGGLISYGPDVLDQYRRSAAYVDRILKGDGPGDLPVQVPTKYETIINLKTAKALGLTIPETLLATADEVIQ
jgi:putative ABC transport system substrate-binding protein